MHVWLCSALRSWKLTQEKSGVSQFEADGSTAVKVAAVISLVFGVLGICGGLNGLLNGCCTVGASDLVQNLPLQSSSMTSGEQTAIKAYLAAAQPAQIMEWVLSFVNLVASLGLILGASRVLKSKQVETALLTFALMFCVVHDLLRGVVACVKLYMTEGLLVAYMDAVGQLPESTNGLSSQFAVAFGQNIQLFFLFFWTVLSLIFYAWAVLSLSYSGEEEEADVV